jgi:thermostable 8-oxoguanine DNA glycosylase
MIKQLNEYLRQYELEREQLENSSDEGAINTIIEEFKQKQKQELEDFIVATKNSFAEKKANALFEKDCYIRAVKNIIEREEERAKVDDDVDNGFSIASLV